MISGIKLYYWVPDVYDQVRSKQDINSCPGQVVLHARQVDRPKYLPDRTSKLKHIENDCLFVIS